MSSTIVKNLNIQIGLYNILSTFAAFLIISAIYGLMIANGNAIVEQLNSELNCQILLALGIAFQVVSVWKLMVLRSKKNKHQNSTPATTLNSVVVQHSDVEQKKFTLKEKKNFLYFLYALSFILIGVLYNISSDIYSAKKSVNWHAVKGNILTSEVIYTSSDEIYRPKVVYSYVVNGKSFQNDRIMFGSVSGNRPSKSRNLIAQFPSGKEVDVFISKDEPGQSVLKTGLQGAGLFLAVIIAGAICMFLGLGIFLLKKSIRKYSA